MSFHPREAQEDQIILKMSICLILALAFGIVCSLYRHNAADYRAIAANPMSGEASFRCELPGEWNSPFTARVAWDGGAQSFSYTAPTGRPDVCSRSEIPVVPVVFPADDPARWFTLGEFEQLKTANQMFFGALAAIALCAIGLVFAFRSYLREKEFQKRY